MSYIHSIGSYTHKHRSYIHKHRSYMHKRWTYILKILEFKYVATSAAEVPPQDNPRLGRGSLRHKDESLGHKNGGSLRHKDGSLRHKAGEHATREASDKDSELNALRENKP